MIRSVLLLAIVACVSIGVWADELPIIRIGSKNFTESYILAEILAQEIEKAGFAKVERRLGMGGTGILYQSLASNEIDVYPEYTGTISLAILHKKEAVDLSHLKRELTDLSLTDSLGFNNSYGLAMPRSLAEKQNIRNLSDLARHGDLRMAFSYEFMERSDGYPALIKHYNLNPPAPIRMDHALVYTALEEGKTDIVEVYTTDSKIEKYDLVVLNDDLNFFPKYDGVFFYRKEIVERFPRLKKIFGFLTGKINEEEMIRLNGLVETQGKSFSEAAEAFLLRDQPSQAEQSDFQVLWALTKRHLLLVFIPIFFAILIGVPMGILAAKMPSLAQVFLIFSGLLQTIPSLALLCFLIPIFGIGIVPSMVALVLYSLLPIVRTTYSGLMGIEKHYKEVAEVIGLNVMQRLGRVELPLAITPLMAGIQTAAVMNVGMATLAAFIGAGGYGSLIVTGLALNDNTIILKGALPAAGMAVLVHFLFEIFERFLTPRGLRV